MPAQKHILVVSQYFYPEGFRINDICAEWVKRGYRVTVVTGLPNYPSGKIYDGYGLTQKRREIWNGVEIIRIPLIPRGSSKLGMVLNYFSFMISGILAGKGKKIQADCVFSFEVSPMTQVLAGISFAKRLGVPHYLYVQDLWPENIVAVTGISHPAVIKPIDKMVDYIYRNVDEIFATSPSFVDAICNRKVPVPAGKVHYWPQYAEDFYVPCEKKEIPELAGDTDFKVVFTGNIGTAQGLEILPAAAELLKDCPVKFVVVGDGRDMPNLQREIEARNVGQKFTMILRQPATRIPEILASCDAAFLSFNKDPIWKGTIPAKLQSYLACGMPVLAAAEGETERVIREADCGKCVPLGDAVALAQAVREMMTADINQMGDHARQYFLTHFRRETLLDEMDTYLCR